MNCIPSAARLLCILLAVCTALLAPGASAVPTVSVLSPAAGATVSSLTTISVTFSESVAGVNADDLLINAEAAALVTGAGAGPYVFTFTQPVAGTVNVQFDGDHGIVGSGGTGALTVPAPWAYMLTDTIAPVMALRTPAASATVGALTQLEVTFSETVTGVNAADLTVNGTLATAMTGSGLGPYVFTFAQPAAGTVTFAWAGGHGIADTAAAPNAFAGGTWTVTRGAGGLGTVIINEFLAANGIGLTDENGDQGDWIELYNAGATTVDLNGWALTNDAGDLGQWVFPSRTLAAGAYLTVYASGKNRAPVSGNLHTNFTINEAGGYLALVSPESPRVAVSVFAAYPEQRTDYSYGPQTGGALRYFATPTPGSANGVSTLTAVTPKVNASVGRGFFKDAFQLVLSCPDATATIRYTTDFSEPTAGTGTVYTTPIAISATKCLRAVAFSNTKIPSLPVTHSYFFLDQLLTQPNTPAGFPTTWGTYATFPSNIIPADYEMDTDPLRTDPNNASSAVDPVKLQRFNDGMRELPIVSVVVPMADMFLSTGLYYGSTVTAQNNVENKAFGYKKCAVEMILPDGSTAFSEICGIGGHGNASRTPSKNPKHGFQLKFKGDYGNGSLSYKLYEDSPVNNFDDIILRPDFNSSWRHWSDDATNVNGAYQRSRGVRIRDAFVKDTFHAMGGVASHHRFFHFFINGLYWGTYDFAEQPVDGFGKSYFGGAKSDYDVIHEGNVRAGDATVYNTMIGEAATTTNALYETMKGYLDLPEFMDYMLLHFYIGHQDWGNVKNWYAIRRRASTTNPTQGKYQYLPWDDECTMLDTNVNRVSSTDVPSGLHTKLLNHPQYRLDFADRVQRHLIAPGGALVGANNIARWQKWQAVIDKPMVAESARWGDYRRDVHQYSTGTYPIYTRENQFLAECLRMTGTYFPGRASTLMGFLQAVPATTLYPAVAAPEYRQTNTGGAVVGTSTVNAGYLLAMNNPGGAGVLYYTTDGNDPHIYYSPTTGVTTPLVNVNYAATAQTYSTPLTINATATIKSRILSGGVWSALNEATFSVGVALPSVRITEIMYNPPGGNAHEFIELQNTGVQSVDMSGWFMGGVDFVFPIGTVLGAGDRLVLANNDGQAGAFATQYPGVTVLGWFGGSLDNGGERIALMDPTGRTIVSVDYDDENGWNSLPDGGGYSLEIIAPNGDPDSPVNWKPSSALKGTPGQPNSALPAPTLVINEVLANNAGAVLVAGVVTDYIELKNTSGAAIDLQGWLVVFGDGGQLSAVIFPTSQVVQPGQFHVIPLSLKNTSGNVRLITPGSVTVDVIDYGNQVPNLAIGRVGGTWVLTTPTVGADNVAASVAPAAANLVLNEWLSDSIPGGADWVELYNKHATLPVALQGLYFQTDTQLYRYPALSFVAPHGYLQLFADEQPGANQLDFKLPATGTALAILDAAGTAVDALTTAQFGTPAQGVSRGRVPDGTATLATFTGSPSPGAANYLNTWTGPVLNEVLARNATGAQAPWSAFADWVELANPTGSDFDLSGVKLGATADAAAAWTFPAGTTIPANGYLAVWCDGGQSASVVTGANLNTGFALGDASGALYLFNAAGQLVNSVEYGFQIPDRSFGLSAGTMKLLATPTRAATNSAAQTLGAVTQLRINEWMAQPGSGGDWFELYNLDANPVAMAGLYLTDDPSELGRSKFQIPALSFIAGQGWVKWEADSTPSAGRNHVNFTLDGGAEYLRLSNNDASITSIDTVSFGQQTTNVSQGRIPDGTSNIVSLPGSPTPGAKNVLLPAPSFTLQPLSQTVAQGANVTLTVAANGSAPLTYQWRFNNTDLGGATGTSLVLSGVTIAQDGTYTCVATNTAGSVPSNSASLIVQSTYVQWAAYYGLTGSATADPDRDGLTNLQEFFHHLNPTLTATTADRAALPIPGFDPPTGTPTYFTLTYRRSARALLTGLDHQLSLTLANGSWSTVTPDVTETLSPDPVTGDPRYRAKFTIAPGEMAKFLRLLLTP